MEKYQNHLKNTYKTALDSSVLVISVKESWWPWQHAHSRSALWLLGCPVLLQMLGKFGFLVKAVSQGKDS